MQRQDCDELDEQMRFTIGWLFQRLCGLAKLPFAACPGEPEEQLADAPVSDRDATLSADCLKALRETANLSGSNHHAVSYLQRGRSTEVGDCKVGRICRLIVESTKSKGYAALFQLIDRCGCLGEYAAQPHSEENFFGKSQRYMLLCAVQWERFPMSIKKHDVPYLGGMPSPSWFDVFFRSGRPGRESVR